MHRPEHVLEAGMLGRGKDPPGGLQLVNLPQPLQPGMVEELLLGNLVGPPPFADRQNGRRKRDIPVDRIVTQAFVLEVAHNG